MQEIIYRALERDPANRYAHAREMVWDLEHQDQVGVALDNARLAILADALEEAGCDDEQILSHCRLCRDHVRGCWLLDLILGKERERSP